MIDGIKSKYIIKHINDFIQDKQFALKLFSCSKNYQKKYDINYSSCYKKYFEHLHFNLNEYLYLSQSQYKKDILKNEYDKFISKNKLDKAKFEKVVYGLVNNQNENDSETYISIDSPLFEILSKTKIFDKKYTLYISKKNMI